MDETVIREYNPEDKSSCIALLKSVFPDLSDEANFTWRFEGRTRKEPVLICAERAGRIVSFVSWIPWEFSFKNKVYLGYQAGEAATEVNHRRKGLLGKVLRYGENMIREMGIDFVFCFPTEMSYGSVCGAGYYPVSPNYFRVRPISPFGRRENAPASIEPAYSYNSMLTEPDKITPVFDDAYLKWRYLDNTKEYEIIEYKENNCMAVFVVRKKKRKGLVELLLLDCQFNTYNERFVDRSIRFLDSIYSRKAVYIRTFLSERSCRGIALRKYFPVRFKSKFAPLMVKPISGRIDNNMLLNCDYWDIMPHCKDCL